MSYRKIAVRVGTSLGGVQRALRRAEDRMVPIDNELAKIRAKRAELMHQLTTEGNPR